jgi:hypothetical protein
MEKIIFNAQLYNSGIRIRSLSGRLGNFIFRTYQNGLITAYYKPRKNEPLSRLQRDNYETLSRQLREMIDPLGLSISSIKSNLPEP